MDSTESTTPAPSSGTIVFLWADTFATTLTKEGQKGIRSPSTGAVVDTKALAQMMIAVPLGDLQTRGVLQLEPFTKKSFGLLSSSGVQARVLGEVAPAGPIEERLTSKKAREKGESVTDLVMLALRRTDTPEGDVVQWGIDEAVRLGLMTRESAGGLRGMTGSKAVTPNAEAIEATRSRATALGDSWLTFRDANPDLARDLRLAIAKGLNARRAHPDQEGDS